ncbi:MAG: MBOAT family protein [Prevotellaceae bacterium]|jgi:D-alanyl-lipoteichoic acid acyltransferase DltB (MBOAT superfamily)|nr:MBOAT family protein [Prevotellaceae bacterium]
MQIDFHKLIELFRYHAGDLLLINSGFFLFLFTAFMGVYCLIYRRELLRTWFVIAFSLFFYYKSNGIYLGLLIFVCVLDYNIGKRLHAAQEKRRRLTLLLISVFSNLGMLAYFKYTNFLTAAFCDMFSRPFSGFNIFLPVGISFFTFQSLSYIIDLYRRNTEPARSFGEYAFYLTFFPRIMAGPIVRAGDFLPQIRQTPFVSKEDFGKAVFLIGTGLFKKAIISDYISLNFVDRIFDSPTLYTGLENLFGVYGYTLQIYCDFSGCTDMALGIALLMGFKLPINFDSPYQSGSITEFWRRWHITLSSWLRDYLYISLGGNRKGKLRMYFNLLITMVLGGLWHGAALRYIIWGTLHGTALVVEKFVKSLVKINGNRLTHIISVMLTFHFVAFCWIFFRADNMSIAGEILQQIGTAFHSEIFFDFVKGYSFVLALMATGYILHFLPRSSENYVQKRFIGTPLVVKICYIVIIIFAVIQMKSSEIQPFIYFQY